MGESDPWQQVWVTKPAKESKLYHAEWMCDRLTKSRKPDSEGRKCVKSVNLGAALVAGRTPCTYCFK